MTTTLSEIAGPATATPTGNTGRSPNVLRLRHLGIDTYQEAVVYMSSTCPVCRAEGWDAETRIQITHRGHSIVATLNVLTGDLLGDDESSLSDVAWRALGAAEGEMVTVAPPPPLDSLSLVRRKIYGGRLEPRDMDAILRDIAAGRYSAIALAAFITGCAGGRLDLDETISLTRAMVNAGERLLWPRAPVMDKHCVGGLPGNRTTMLVVPIVAAAGLIIPKTSSRAITSPAGTADAMECVAPVTLELPAMRRVVEREGGCITWGGGLRLSPADDIIIRVERPLELDSDAQLVASVLSKKVAAGSTHVVIDIPIGPTAKVRTADAAAVLGTTLIAVGRAVGLHVEIVQTDGSQPVGSGVGPALEARDVLAVLRGEAGAPADLRDRALTLAARVLEMAGAAASGLGRAVAASILGDGRAWRKFQAICDAQGGMREPGRAPYTHEIVSAGAGRVTEIDNRRLARVAKLAGAPKSPTAGLELHAPLSARVEVGSPLYTLHAESPGELAYAVAYTATHAGIIVVSKDGDRAQ